MGRRVVESETPAELRDLRAFCLVADLRSVTAAAKALGESKGSVSRRLSRLEGHLGAVLLRRSPRLVQPTDDGVAFRARVGRALEVLDDATARLHDARSAPRGHLRVTMPIDVGLAVFGPIVARFVDENPEVTIDILLTERRLDFDADQIDVAIRAAASLDDSTLVAHALQKIEARFYASRRYLKRHGAPEKPADLRDHRLIAVHATRGAKTFHVRELETSRSTLVRVRAVVAANDYSFAREVAIAGAGVALLPSNIAADAVDDGRLVRVLPAHADFSGAIYLLHHGARFLTPKVRAFRDHVLAAFGVRRARA